MVEQVSVVRSRVKGDKKERKEKKSKHNKSKSSKLKTSVRDSDSSYTQSYIYTPVKNSNNSGSNSTDHQQQFQHDDTLNFDNSSSNSVSSSKGRDIEQPVSPLSPSQSFKMLRNGENGSKKTCFLALVAVLCVLFLASSFVVNLMTTDVFEPPEHKLRFKQFLANQKDPEIKSYINNIKLNINRNPENEDDFEDDESMKLEAKILELSKQVYQGDKVLPWENPYLKKLKQKVATNLNLNAAEESLNGLNENENEKFGFSGSSEITGQFGDGNVDENGARKSLEDELEDWVNDQILDWLHSGKEEATFEALAKKKIAEAKVSGGSTLDEDVRAIIEVKKQLVSKENLARVDELKKKQKTVEDAVNLVLKSGQGNKRNENVGYVDKKVEVKVPDYLKSLGLSIKL